MRRWRAIKKICLKTLLRSAALIIIGSALFAFSFNIFLQPAHINAGGVSGIGQLISHLSGFGSVALWSFILNVPLFLLGLKSIGKNFFIGSLAGMLLSSLFLSLSENIPAPDLEPLMRAVFGGAGIGAGLGLVFIGGASTGGSDIAARLLRPVLPELPIGRLMLIIDIVIVAFTGIVFGDISRALYSAVCLYVSSLVIDSIIYGLDYSSMAIIVSERYEEIGRAINSRLDRGVTVLEGRGFYTGQEKNVLLSAMKKRQAAELKALVSEIDPDAFIILSDAHQVLGDGFKRYNKMEL
ncbi:MAG: YitT family protein [Ruminococcaceae bacterium]|nr:YitT family protein [Oscillospiraceae bacterium]